MYVELNNGEHTLTESERMDIMKKTLTINCLSDIMLQCAIEKGYKTPCKSLNQYYGNPAIFTHDYYNHKYKMVVYDKKTNKSIVTFLL